MKQLVIIFFISVFCILYGLRLLNKFNKNYKNESDRILLMRSSEKQEIYGIIMIGVIGFIGSVIIYITKF